MSEYSKDVYKEAYRLACHNLVMTTALLYGETIVKGKVDNEIVFTDKYYEDMKDTQDMFLEMAKEQTDENNI